MDPATIAAALGLAKGIIDAVQSYHAGTATNEQLDLLRAASAGKVDAAVASIDAALAAKGAQP